jgi:glutathione S-transferase
MRHGSIALYEPLAIAAYLNEEFPGNDLEASSGLERARMFQWISVACDYLYPGVVTNVGFGETGMGKSIALRSQATRSCS